MSATEKIRTLNLRSVGHFDDRWQFADVRLVTKPDLMGPYVVLCHSVISEVMLAGRLSFV